MLFLEGASVPGYRIDSIHRAVAVTAIAEGSSSASAQGVPDIAQEPVSGSTASQWLPEEQSDGSWQLENDSSGLCLDVYGAGSNTGQQLDQWPCKNTTGTNQDFKA